MQAFEKFSCGNGTACPHRPDIFNKGDPVKYDTTEWEVDAPYKAFVEANGSGANARSLYSFALKCPDPSADIKILVAAWTSQDTSDCVEVGYQAITFDSNGNGESYVNGKEAPLKTQKVTDPSRWLNQETLSLADVKKEQPTLNGFRVYINCCNLWERCFWKSRLEYECLAKPTNDESAADRPPLSVVSLALLGAALCVVL